MAKKSQPATAKFFPQRLTKLAQFRGKIAELATLQKAKILSLIFHTTTGHTSLPINMMPSHIKTN